MTKFADRHDARHAACSKPASPALKCEVGKALRESTYPSLKHVQCERRERLVILRGQTPTHYLKQLAQEIALKTEGVEVVDNQIIVVPLVPHSNVTLP